MNCATCADAHARNPTESQGLHESLEPFAANLDAVASGTFAALCFRGLPLVAISFRQCRVNLGVILSTSNRNRSANAIASFACESGFLPPAVVLNELHAHIPF
jgi:hypothetical protein